MGARPKTIPVDGNGLEPVLPKESIVLQDPQPRIDRQPLRSRGVLGKMETKDLEKILVAPSPIRFEEDATKSLQQVRERAKHEQEQIRLRRKKQQFRVRPNDLVPSGKRLPLYTRPTETRRH